MSILLAELEQQARALPPDERAHLAEVLLESLQSASPPEIGAEWQREIESRVAAFETGGTQLFPAGEVFADARRKAS